MKVLRAQPDWTHTAVKADEADIERPKLSAAGKLHLSREFQPGRAQKEGCCWIQYWRDPKLQKMRPQ